MLESHLPARRFCSCRRERRAGQIFLDGLIGDPNSASAVPDADESQLPSGDQRIDKTGRNPQPVSRDLHGEEHGCGLLSALFALVITPTARLSIRSTMHLAVDMGTPLHFSGISCIRSAGDSCGGFHIGTLNFEVPGVKTLRRVGRGDRLGGRLFRPTSIPGPFFQGREPRADDGNHQVEPGVGGGPARQTSPTPPTRRRPPVPRRLQRRPHPTQPAARMRDGSGSRFRPPEAKTRCASPQVFKHGIARRPRGRRPRLSRGASRRPSSWAASMAFM